MTDLQEKLGIIPFSVKEIVKLHDYSVYSSEKLKSSFIDIVAKNKLISPVRGPISNLINDDVIVPGFMSKNIIKLLLHKKFANGYKKTLMGIYHPESHKIYILMDNNVNLFSWVSDKNVSQILLHEVMHYACRQDQNKFFNIFKDMFASYYSKFFEIYAGIQIESNSAKRIAKFLISNFENTKQHNVNLKVYYEFMKKELSVFGKKRAEGIAMDVASAFGLYMKNNALFVTTINNNKQMNKMFYALIDAYKEIGIVDPDTTAAQELMWPSEIAAIACDKPNSLHYKAINLLT